MRRPFLTLLALAALTLTLLSLAILTLAGTATAEARSYLGGTEVTVTSSFQSVDLTGGAEVPFGEPVTVQINRRKKNEPELVQFIGIYGIDIDSRAIGFTYNLSDGSHFDPARVIEPGTYDRYYFEFESDILIDAWADRSQSLVPMVTVLSPSSLVVEMSPGMEIGDGFDAVIRLRTSRRVPSTLLGTKLTVSNNFQSEQQTGGNEVAFGNPATAPVVHGDRDPEFVQFIGLYDIDIDAKAIRFTYNLSDAFPFDPARVIEPGTFDRYYFEFNSDILTHAWADRKQQLVPNVTVLSPSCLVVEIGPGMQIGNGFDALIRLRTRKSGLNG